MSNHEEADTRIILHAINAVQMGYGRLMIVSTDNDVLVSFCHFIFNLCSEVWNADENCQSGYIYSHPQDQIRHEHQKKLVGISCSDRLRHSQPILRNWEENYLESFHTQIKIA